MIEAFGWGALGASALALGSALAMRFSLGNRPIALLMAFASGILISAIAYELVLTAVEDFHPGGAALGLFAGAATFFVGDVVATRRARRSGLSIDAEGAPPTTIIVGRILDGVPESVVLGLTLLQGEAAVTVLVSIWVANLPEAMAGTKGLQAGGWNRAPVFLLWGGVMLVSAVGSAAGYGLFTGASDRTIAFVLAFAGGAILTMLADTMMPEAFEHAGPLVGVVTTLGFASAYAVQSLT